MLHRDYDLVNVIPHETIAEQEEVMQAAQAQ